MKIVDTIRAVKVTLCTVLFTSTFLIFLTQHPPLTILENQNHMKL